MRKEKPATIVINELAGAYRRSGSPEDLVRITGITETDQLSWVFDLESMEREVKGRLQFYEVDVDEDTGKRRALEIGDWKDSALTSEIIDQMHTGEISKGVVKKIVVVKAGESDMEIDPSNFKELLRVEDKALSVSTGQMLDLMNQARFANGLLTPRKHVVDKMEKELAREAIMVGMGLVDIDGEINEKRILELVGGGEKLLFKDAGGKEIDISRIRLKMIMEKVGEKTMDYLDGREDSVEIKLDRGEKKEDQYKANLHFGGIRETSEGMNDMFNEHKMQFMLADGMWQFLGLKVAHWDKEHKGNSKDWHRKTVHFEKYLSMFGIGPAHLRQHASVNYHDFITRRKGDILPELFKGKHLKMFRGEKIDGVKNQDLDFERREIINALMLDRDGVLMSRQRFLDIFGRYRHLLKTKGRKKADKFIRERVEEKAIYQFGKAKGLRLVEKHWGELAKADWSKPIKEGIDEGDVPADKDERKGFAGLYWWVKKNYVYANLRWGRGKRPDDTVWGQRLYKEAQYLFSADKYRLALLSWLGKPESADAMIEAVRVPGYYGTSDSNRKSQLLLRRYNEYFSRNLLGGIETTPVDQHTNMTIKGEKPDPFDGTIIYPTMKVGPGQCLSKEERRLGPYTPSQFEKVIKQFQRAGKLQPRYANETLGNMVELGKIGEWCERGVERVIKNPILAGITKKPFQLLFGANVSERIIKIGSKKFKIWGEGRFPGVLGFIWKWIKKLWTDTWAVRKDIIRGTMQEMGNQAGGMFKGE